MRAAYGLVGARLCGWALLAACSSLALLPSCTKEPTTAAPGLYTLSGRVRLTGYLVAPDGRFAGTRVVDDADGVEVELFYGSAVLGRATTVDGVYRFPSLAPGGYQVRATVVGNVADLTHVITIVSWDLMAGDTLRLTSIGDLYPLPNPAADTVSISFGVFEGQPYDVKIRNLKAAPIQTLLTAVAATTGLRVVKWDGRDGAGNPATATMYWVTFESGIDIRAQLLFR